MTYKIQFLAAAMVFLFPFFSQGEDISTISIEKNGDMVEAPAPAPVSLEAWIPKKVQKESSLQTEDQGLRQAVLDYFADSTYDESLMNYACNFTDLSGDGGKEALVLLESPYTDRDGKPELLIFTRDGEGWHMAQEITGISVPFLIPRRDKKTSSGVRYVPMSEGVAECFRRVVANRPKPPMEPVVDGVSGFLFLDKNQMPRVALHWEKYFQYAVAKHNRIYKDELPKITPHVCRHTFCSKMARKGMDPVKLKYVMGHSDIDVTYNTYTHLGFDDVKADVLRFEEEAA